MIIFGKLRKWHKTTCASRKHVIIKGTALRLVICAFLLWWQTGSKRQTQKRSIASAPSYAAVMRMLHAMLPLLQVLILLVCLLRPYWLFVYFTITTALEYVKSNKQCRPKLFLMLLPISLLFPPSKEQQYSKNNILGFQQAFTLGSREVFSAKP